MTDTHELCTLAPAKLVLLTNESGFTVAGLLTNLAKLNFGRETSLAVDTGQALGTSPARITTAASHRLDLRAFSFSINPPLACQSLLAFIIGTTLTTHRLPGLGTYTSAALDPCALKTRVTPPARIITGLANAHGLCALACVKTELLLTDESV